jgi:hypothetical protein
LTHAPEAAFIALIPEPFLPITILHRDCGITHLISSIRPSIVSFECLLANLSRIINRALPILSILPSMITYLSREPFPISWWSWNVNFAPDWIDISLKVFPSYTIK